jgi:RHS repeat-associated protein
MGWNIDMGAIQRATKRGVDYTTNNYTAVINGSSSELVPRTDWGTNYYGARIEGTLSKYYYNTGTGGWEATSRDGTKYYYGSTSASRQDFDSGTKIFKWCLDKVQDTNGNYMTVSYTKDQGEIYLDRIDYTGNTITPLGTTHYVKFHLEPRTDVPIMFTPNYQAKTAKRLKTIEVRSQGAMVRAYSLTYGASARTARSLLSTVQQFGNDAILDGEGTITGGTALPETAVTYSGEDSGTFSAPVVTATPDFSGYTKTIADVNGDGRADLVYLNNVRIVVWLSKGDGTFADRIVTATADYAGYIQMAADVNGDGKADLVYLFGTRIVVFLGHGDGTFSAPVVTATPDFSSYTKTIADVNGDGKADLVYFLGTKVVIWPGKGDGTFADRIVTVTPDFSGYTKTIADMNGDGRADLVYFLGTRIVVFLGHGDGTFSAPVVTATPDFSSYTKTIADVNGDGKADLVYFHPVRIVVWLSKGDGTFADRIVTATADYTGYTQMAADVNGDGRADLVYLHPVRIAVWFSKGDGLPFHAKTVKDPLGGVTSLAYTPSSAYQNTLMPFILQAVSSITRDDGRGHSYTTQYSYAGGLFDPVEREFLGFRYAASYQMRDASTYESKTEAWYHQDTTRKGLIEAELTTSFEGHTRQVNNTWTIGTMTGGVTWPRLDTVQSAITDAGYAPYAYSIDYVYDPVYLNVTREYRYGASEEEDVDTFFTYTNYTTPWIVARPTSVTVRDAAGNIKSARWMTYHAATGNLFTEEVCKSDIPASECVNSNPTRNPVITYQYTTEGNVSSATDPMDHTTSYTYDAAAKTFVYETVNAAGHVTRTVYHPGTGKLTSLVPPHLYGTGYAITSQYDVFGRLTREDRPDGGYTTYLYANLGNPAAQFVEKKEHIAGGSSPIDHYSDAFFDGLGRTYRVWSSGPEGKTIALDTGYDVIGRVSHRSNPYFAGIDTPVYTTFQYDGLSRITHTTSPDSGQVITSYQGLTRQVRDQNGHWSASTYDVHNRLRVAQDACGIVTAYTYDTLGNLIQVAAAYGQSEQNVTAMTYDSMGKKRSMTDPDMGYWTYSYDKAGNLTSQTDAKGQTVAFTYDAINRLIQKVYPTHTVASTYDDPSVPYSKGMLTSTLDPSGGETKEDSVLAFDIMQRATGSQKTIGTSSITISKTYDTSGRTLTMTYGTNPQRSYGYVYDVAGNTVGLWDYTTSSYHVQYSGHTASGQPTGALFPKPNTVSIRTSYTYDPYTMRLDTLVTERLQGQNPVATLQHLTYDHDLKGNILTLADTVNTITHTYTYDALDRLTTANGTGSTPYSHTYAYDVIGNITSRSDVGSYTYLYGNKPHAVRQAGNLTFQYDANGNMTQRYDGSTAVTLDLTWNYDNKPSVISRRVGGGASQPYLTFTYDGSSQRVKKENHFTGAATLYFGEVYEVRNGEPIIHLFANNQRVVSIQEDGRMQYYHGNHLNSASVVTDGYGNTKETIEYYPFGTYRQRTDLDAAFPNVHHTFTGQEEDDETGLLNYKARLYDPLLGRFISADSIVPEPGNLQAYNRYSYCLNNPLIYTDPSGQFSLGDALNSFISGLVGALAAAAVIVAIAGTGGLAAPLSLSWGTLALAGAAGGVAAGGTGTALSGAGFQGIIQAAALGGAMGAIGGGIASFGAGAVYAMMAAGAGVAYATNGLDGLASYGAGMMGAMAGGALANYAVKNWSTSNQNMNNTGSSATNTSWQQNEKKVNLQLAVNQGETIQLDINVITCTERTTWDYVKEWLITPMGGKVEGTPKVSGMGPCGCEWARTGFAEDCYAGGKYLFSRPVNTIFTTGKTAITVGGASGHGCICPNPNGELQPWARNHYRSH